MQIVIPMAGESRRFKEAGYGVLKFMLPAFGRTLFDHAVGSFGSYFKTADFLFVVRDDDAIAAFVEERSTELGIERFKVVRLSQPTRGQAETVALGIRQGGVASTDALVIFNIDTFRLKWTFPPEFTASGPDGYLEVFRGEGENWSFARLDSPTNRVVETAEKRAISDLCSTGLYYFRRSSDFLAAFDKQATLTSDRWDAGELYVAPLYNPLISDGKDIRVHIIARDEVIFCGVPDEYDAFLSKDAWPPA